MSFSLTKALKNGFGAFFKNIWFLLGVITVTELMWIGYQALLFASNKSMADLSYAKILAIRLFPGLSLVPPMSPALLIVIGLCGALFLNYLFALYWQIMIEIHTKGRSSWAVFGRVLDLTTLMRLMGFFFVAGALTLACFITVLVLFALSVHLLVTVFSWDVTWLYDSERVINVLVVTNIATFMMLFSYFCFRYYFAIPRIIADEELSPSMRASWSETKKLGCKGIALFLVAIIPYAHSLLLSTALLSSQQQQSTLSSPSYVLIMRMLRHDLVVMLVISILIAAWAQVYQDDKASDLS